MRVSAQLGETCLLFGQHVNTAAPGTIANHIASVYSGLVERDWYRRVMLKLADARETRSGSEYLSEVDSELDAVIMKMEELRRTGGMSGFSVKRGLAMLNDLRGRLENARNPHEVTSAFLELDSVRDLVDEALQSVSDRD